MFYITLCKKVFIFQTTIGDFKKKIASSVNIPPNQQRLIFQGRVLQDDYVLSPGG